ncbi:hypothetical protein QGZ99_03410 [Kingella kingae]|uniref:hypothetical protein n=1 Tax=Kingella kingae TaxID=504 RepID=UPI0012BABB5B|nr:hypothetical protein [Kingella kingae]MDK4540712.1 hypothetical protein [Kingella kingae]MDK4553173.1 hypothetical protein [Kingella kingae]UOP03585.1 hypothetical protein LVJ79_03300 [Kingella kingae]
MLMFYPAALSAISHATIPSNTANQMPSHIRNGRSKRGFCTVARLKIARINWRVKARFLRQFCKSAKSVSHFFGYAQCAGCFEIAYAGGNQRQYHQ